MTSFDHKHYVIRGMLARFNGFRLLIHDVCNLAQLRAKGSWLRVATFSKTMMERALLYHEPGVVVILTLTSFFLLLNLIGHILDKLILCGLLGQLFIGVA